MDLSVIIPVYGRQRYIAACLRSVTRCPRDNMDMECIVVSDGSDNEMAAVADRYIERDNRIRLVIMEAGETTDARNIGIEKASGRYLLFLDAADRLCEDAWEQIEAAVEEEYADFVAFSHITSRGNGKLRAQMLPISDVISTDEREARWLMYTDSVLDSCGGKLFKSRIVRDNNIFFGMDFMFVSEYFEHSESYLLTKAMILYCPPRSGGAEGGCSGEERMDRIRFLYDAHVSAVKRYNDSALTKGMRMYFLRMLTDLFSAYVTEGGRSRGEVDALYESILGSAFLGRFLDEVDESGIASKSGRYAYQLLREKDAAKLRRYLAVRTGNVAVIWRYF
ncbi:MAG: glycosyltransferase family 2 protein [Lachnospiraceae bacterium]